MQHLFRRHSALAPGRSFALQPRQCPRCMPQKGLDDFLEVERVTFVIVNRLHFRLAGTWPANTARWWVFKVVPGSAATNQNKLS